MSNPDLPPDSITTLPPDGRLAAIRERYNDMAYSGPTAADRERDTIIGHLLDCLEAAERRVLERDGARATRADGGGRGVSGLDAAIRAKLAEIDDSMGRTGSLWGAEEMRAAIMAVLDRHKPGYPDGPEYEEHDEPVFDRAGIPQGHVRVQGEQIPGYWCETCREFTPCPTVRDIAKELGIEASDA